MSANGRPGDPLRRVSFHLRRGEVSAHQMQAVAAMFDALADVADWRTNEDDDLDLQRMTARGYVDGFIAAERAAEQFSGGAA